MCIRDSYYSSNKSTSLSLPIVIDDPFLANILALVKVLMLACNSGWQKIDIPIVALNLIRRFHSEQPLPSNGIALVLSCLPLIRDFVHVRIMKVTRLLVSEAHELIMLARR